MNDVDDIHAFLRWHCGPLLETRNRSAYALWLVHRALALEPGEHRQDKTPGLLNRGETCLAVQSAAWLQPGQATPGSVSFAVGPRSAPLHVFGLLAERNPQLVNPLDADQWRFWVVPTAALHPDRQSIGLQALQRAYGEGINYNALAARIAASGLWPAP